MSSNLSVILEDFCIAGQPTVSSFGLGLTYSFKFALDLVSVVFGKERPKSK